MAISRQPIIAVFDSGIGGMTILASLVGKIPTARFIYFGDTANAPYGPRSSEEIFFFSVQAIEKLLAYKPDVIVIACNTVTSTSITRLREKFPNTIFVGVEPAVKPATIVTQKKKIAVAATAGTLRSESYQTLKKTWGEGVEIFDVQKPTWVAMVENNAIENDALKRDAQEIRQTGADVLVLACTHFPFLKKKLQKLLPEILIIDSAEPVAHRVGCVLGEPTGPVPTLATITWLFSDPTRPDEASRENLWTVAQQIK